MIMSLLTKTFPVGALGCNCTIVHDDKSKYAIIIDAGDEAEKIEALLAEQGLKPIAFLHTHAHFDHIMATQALAPKHECKVGLHKEDEFLWKNLERQGKLFGMPTKAPEAEITDWLDDEKSYQLGEHEIKVVHTPGHTPGSCCFHLETSETSMLFSGDTLFRGGIGRTDLWGGDHRKILDSIKNRLFKLDIETEVIPGHGPTTSIEYEKSENPFLQ